MKKFESVEEFIAAVRKEDCNTEIKGCNFYTKEQALHFQSIDIDHEDLALFVTFKKKVLPVLRSKKAIVLVKNAFDDAIFLQRNKIFRVVTKEEIAKLLKTLR